MANKGSVPRWQLNYVAEQQDRAFRASQALSLTIQRGEIDEIEEHFTTLISALAAQSETIGLLAGILAGEDSVALEKQLGAIPGGLGSEDGDSS